MPVHSGSDTPRFPVDLDRVRKHYDRLSFLYRMFWGEHLHHGYWNGGETPEQAQIQLMEQLARRAAIPRGANVFDIGCGVGGSALWLAEQYECRVNRHHHQSGAGGDGKEKSKVQRAG